MRRRTAARLILGSALFPALPACTRPEPDPGDVVDVLSREGEFSTLLTAVEAAGLTPTLRSPGPLTLFAPTDTAFARLGKGAVPGLLEPRNRGRLQEVVAYHVLPEERFADDYPPGTSRVPTVQGQALTVDTSAGVQVDQARVVRADVETNHGVIHVIDAVLMPQG